jgi:ABC-type lipopolysaccharide export system ATPase subunit
MTLPGIVVTGVRRSFGHVHAVRDVSFEARAGAVTGLVGPNGSGKTTLMLMLASLLAPDAGTIRIGGVDPLAEPAAARALLGWMPDALGAWPTLTARETLVMTGRLYGLDAEAARAGAARLLDEVGLGTLSDAPARVLSRGRSSASVSRAPSCTIPACCCWTSRPRAWTRRRASTCACCCAASPPRGARSSSPATSSPSSRRSSTRRCSSSTAPR